MSEVDESQALAVDKILSRLLRAIRAGKLELKTGDKGLSLVQHLKDDKELTYREMCAADKAKVYAINDDPIKRMHFLLGLLSGLGTDVIGKLKGADMRIGEAVAGFFLALY